MPDDIRVVTYGLGGPITVDTSQQSAPVATVLTDLYRHESDRAAGQDPAALAALDAAAGTVTSRATATANDPNNFFFLITKKNSDPFGMRDTNGSASGSIVNNGTLALNAASAYSGGTTIGAGTLQLGNGGVTGSLSVDNASSTLVVQSGPNTGEFQKRDVSSVLGNVTFGAGTNFGIQVFNGGTLQYAGGNTQDVSSAIAPIAAAQAASNDTNGNTVAFGAGLSGAGGSLFVGNGGASGTFAGSIQNFSGAAALYKTGSGMLTLSGNGVVLDVPVTLGTLVLGNSDSGHTMVNGGVLIAANTAALADFHSPILNNGVLVYSGSSDAAWSLSGASWSLSGGTVAYIDGKPIDLQLHGGTSPKLVETWKPARVIPNRSRLMVGEKEELPLKGMQVDVRVDGFRARVLIDMYYYNDRQQQLEGNFQLRLPDEASPYFFAFGRTVYQAPQVTAADSMFFKPQQVSLGDTTPEKILQLRGKSWEQPKVARMVPKEKAAVAYRDTVRRRVDPALVEWSGAGVFQCRVFPLAPHSLHRVTVGYDVDLVRVGDDLELRLDLPAETPATIVDLNIAAADARQVSLDAPATLTPSPSPGGRGESAAPPSPQASLPVGEGSRRDFPIAWSILSRVRLPCGYGSRAR